MLLVYDEIYGDHLRGIAHPESPDRVEAVAAFLRKRGDLQDALAARDATAAEIERVHSEGYLNLVRTEAAALRGRAGYLSTGDVVLDEGSPAVAVRAAGGAIVAAQASYERKTASFAIVRPPGHHAEPARGMGFCLFNNAAIAARAVQDRTGASVLIADFDYHHGNGTQAVSGEGLSYMSTHAFPAYPGSGGISENYALPQNAAVVNIPLPPHHFGTEAFVALWTRALPLVMQRLRPAMIVVSAGFDYVTGDPVGDLGVDVFAAAHLANVLRDAAATYCEGRIAYVLEGGYDTRALAESIGLIIDTHRDAIRPSETADASAIPPAQRAILERVRRGYP